jgi:thiol-disulfide isomerase/thioredoxin
MCLTAKPSVDRLESKYRSRIDFIRIEIGSRIGNDVVRLYNVTTTPTYIIFSRDGTPLDRQIGGFPNEAMLQRALDDSG